LVEIEGFDEFMAEIHESAGLNLPDPIAHPFSVARARAKLFVDDNSGLRRNSVIDKDIQSIHDELQRYPEEVFAQRDHRISAATALLLATIARDNGDLELALRFAKRAVEAEPSDHLSAHIYANVLADLGNYEQLKTFVEESALTMLQKIYYLLRAGANEEVITMAEEALEANPSDWYSRINRAIALKRKGSLEDFEGDLAALEGMKPVEKELWNLAAGIAALRHQKEDMLRYIELAHKNGQLTIKSLKEFPVFEDFGEDEDLQELVLSLQNPSPPSNGSA
jgi:tetratricopeptide (TPR) repeat protein